jgi:hypothetical protein
MDWIHLAQDRDQLQVLVYTIMSVGFQVIAEVVMKDPVFWDLMPCRPLKVNHCF